MIDVQHLNADPTRIIRVWNFRMLENIEDETYADLVLVIISIQRNARD